VSGADGSSVATYAARRRGPFPAIGGRDADVDALIIVLITGHRALAAHVAELCENRFDAATLEERLDALGMLLETRVRREERRLFRRLQAGAD
jgi:hypothetical protein